MEASFSSIFFFFSLLGMEILGKQEADDLVSESRGRSRTLDEDDEEEDTTAMMMMSADGRIVEKMKGCYDRRCGGRLLSGLLRDKK